MNNLRWINFPEYYDDDDVSFEIEDRLNARNIWKGMNQSLLLQKLKNETNPDVLLNFKASIPPYQTLQLEKSFNFKGLIPSYRLMEKLFRGGFEPDAFRLSAKKYSKEDLIQMFQKKLRNFPKELQQHFTDAFTLFLLGDNEEFDNPFQDFIHNILFWKEIRDLQRLKYSRKPKAHYEHHLDEIDYQEILDHFRQTLDPSRYKLVFSDLEKKLLIHMCSNPSISLFDLANILQITEEEISSTLNNLNKKGIRQSHLIVFESFGLHEFLVGNWQHSRDEEYGFHLLNTFKCHPPPHFYHFISNKSEFRSCSIIKSRKIFFNPHILLNEVSIQDTSADFPSLQVVTNTDPVEYAEGKFSDQDYFSFRKDLSQFKCDVSLEDFAKLDDSYHFLKNTIQNKYPQHLVDYLIQPYLSLNNTNLMQLLVITNKDLEYFAKKMKHILSRDFREVYNKIPYIDIYHCFNQALRQPTWFYFITIFPSDFDYILKLFGSSAEVFHITK